MACLSDCIGDKVKKAKGGSCHVLKATCHRVMRNGSKFTLLANANTRGNKALSKHKEDLPTEKYKVRQKEREDLILLYIQDEQDLLLIEGVE